MAGRPAEQPQPGCDQVEVRLADDVANALARGDTLKDAIDDAVTRWMDWRIDRRTCRDTGIPAGLPYLTGFAAHFEILAETDA